MKKITLSLLSIIAVANAGTVVKPAISEVKPVISDTSSDVEKNYWYGGSIGAVNMMKGDSFGNLEGLTIGKINLNVGGVKNITKNDTIRVEAGVIGATKLLNTDRYKPTKVSNARVNGKIELSHKTKIGRGYVSIGDIDTEGAKLIGTAGVGNYFFAPLNFIGVSAGYENAKGCDAQLSYIYKTAPQTFGLWDRYTKTKDLFVSSNTPIHFETHYKGSEKYSVGFEDLYIKDKVNIAYLESSYRLPIKNVILSGQYIREDNNDKFTKNYKLDSNTFGIKASMSKNNWFGYVAYNHIGDNGFNAYSGILGGNPLFTSSEVARGELGGPNTNAGRALVGYDFGNRKIALSVFHSKGDTKEINGIELTGKRTALDDRLTVESHIGYFKDEKNNKKDLLVNASISYNF